MQLFSFITWSSSIKRNASVKIEIDKHNVNVSQLNEGPHAIGFAGCGIAIILVTGNGMFVEIASGIRDKNEKSIGIRKSGRVIFTETLVI